MREIPRGPRRNVAGTGSIRLRAIRDPEAGALLDGYYSDLRDALDALLQAAARRFGCTLPRREPGLVVFGLLDGVTQQWAIAPDRTDLGYLRELLTETLMDLLGAEPPR